MPGMPVSFLINQLFNLLTILILVVQGYFFRQWYQGAQYASVYLLWFIVLFGLTVAGKYVVLFLIPHGKNEEFEHHYTTKWKLIPRNDGTKIYTEHDGLENGNVVVLVHGWGLNLTAWKYQRQQLVGDYRVISMDLAGLGNSDSTHLGDYSLERMAVDLHTVLSRIPDVKPVLVGHSIGGMVILVFCSLFPEYMSRLSGIVFVNTTYVNPLQTSIGSTWTKMLEKPIIKPFLQLVKVFWPVFEVLNLLSYLNGSLHLQTFLTGFTGTQSIQQLEYTTRYALRSPIKVVVQGDLEMLKLEAKHVLSSITVPTLVLSGEYDILTLPEASISINRAIPGSTLKIIERAGHMGFVEQHEQYTNQIELFLQRVFPQNHAKNRQDYLDETA